MRARITHLLRPVAIGAGAVALVGGVAVTTAAWPADGERAHEERPVAASETRVPVVRGLWPRIVNEYATLVAQGKVEESLRVIAYLHEGAWAAQAVTSGRSGGSSCGDSLECIRECESHGDYGAVSSSGTYRGAYQFSQSTWEAVGGTGDPAAAPPEEQDLRAGILYESTGSSPWPSCG